MGMFDSVVFGCPNCGEEIKAQSKEGPCALNEYPRYSVPMKIATDLHGGLVACGSCHAKFRIRSGIPKLVQLTLELRGDDE